MEGIIIVIVLIFLLFLAFILLFTAFKITKLKKEDKIKMHKIKNELGAKLHSKLKHFYGLPISENTMCDFFYCDDKLVIKGGGASFSLNTNRILDSTIKTDVEIQKMYVSSVGGAVAGGVLFGPIGAIIGGRAKEKKSNNNQHYLIISYEKEDDLKYLSFNVSDPQSRIEAIKIQNEIQKLNNSIKQIEL